MKYAIGQRIIASFGVSSNEYRTGAWGSADERHGLKPIAHEGEVIERLPMTHDGKNRYLVRLDRVGNRDYVMLEDELTTIEELFG